MRYCSEGSGKEARRFINWECPHVMTQTRLPRLPIILHAPRVLMGHQHGLLRSRYSVHSYLFMDVRKM